jgi:hypothetical protein
MAEWSRISNKEGRKAGKAKFTQFLDSWIPYSF